MFSSVHKFSGSGWAVLEIGATGRLLVRYFGKCFAVRKLGRLGGRWFVILENVSLSGNWGGWAIVGSLFQKCFACSGNDRTAGQKTKFGFAGRQKQRVHASAGFPARMCTLCFIVWPLVVLSLTSVIVDRTVIVIDRAVFYHIMDDVSAVLKICSSRNLPPYRSSSTSTVFPSPPGSADADSIPCRHPELHLLQSPAVSLRILPPAQIPARSDSCPRRNS